MISFTMCSTRIGQRLTGVSKTPSIIKKNLMRDNFYTNKIIFYDFMLNDNYSKYDNKNFNTTFQNAKYIYNMNRYALENNRVNINIGGDHSISLGSVAASKEKYGDDLIVLWVDAHADINNYEKSISKNTHGMPVYYLLHNNDCLENSDWLDDNKLTTDQIIYFGLRDVDDYEKSILEDMNITHCGVLDEKYYPRHFNKLKNIIKNKKVHLSIDVDALDPKYMPSTGSIAKQGLSMEYLLDLIDNIRDRVVNVDVVELNLDIGSREDKILSLKNTLSIIDEITRIG